MLWVKYIHDGYEERFPHWDAVIWIPHALSKCTFTYNNL